jgi:glycosyltransferase involved in cell wall biosynthesis
MNHRIIGIAQVYNELRRGNLERFVQHVRPLVDDLVVYDDASTDGSYEYLLAHTPHIIRGLSNDFGHEIQHKQLLLGRALTLHPDFILWLDVDEVMTAGAKQILPALCDRMIAENIDGLAFHEINLWRSSSWRRVDCAYDDGWFVRLWRVKPGISFDTRKTGLHVSNYPETLTSIQRSEDLQVIHYGFASDKALAHKFLNYRAHGQSGWPLHRLLNEDGLRLEKVPQVIFPTELWSDDTAPQQRSYDEALTMTDTYRADVTRPSISIVCLVYKSTHWLDFAYDQLLRHTDMTDKEFFFVANDATPEVLAYLRDRYIPHYVWSNNEHQRQEWYINNVYRAWNHAARIARGDLILFINSDMAFSPGWLDHLFDKLNGKNCVASRLVESGKLPSGPTAISRDFGRTIEQFRQGAFLNYADQVAIAETNNGGLYMPLLIRRDDFMAVGGYPEGNIVPGSDIWNPTIARKGEPCISGDVVLMQKLAAKGIQHQTSFDSIVYHFQCGEMDDQATTDQLWPPPSLVICNDYIQGRMGETTMWGFLLEGLPSAVAVDHAVMGTSKDVSAKAREYIHRHHPQTEVIIQNATFMDLVDPDRFTITYLQDNLRAMGRQSDQQDLNLQHSDIRVTNSSITARFYPEFDFEIIPIGVDADLFRPMDKVSLRQELNLPAQRTGIFVGDFTETKGWSAVRQVIDQRTDIFWILVSKGTESHTGQNCRTYNRIDQKTLARLLNCADFFILGSPVETQCLAAIEACLCDIPVVMPLTGVFSDFSQEDRDPCGIFTHDLPCAVDAVGARTFTPRDIILKSRLTIPDMVNRWELLLRKAHLMARSQVYDPRMSHKLQKRKWRRLYPYLFWYRNCGWYASDLKRISVNVLRKVLPSSAFCFLRESWRKLRASSVRR